MQPDRFTIKSQEALQAAQRLAENRRNPQLTPEHLLAVLLEQDGGVVVPVLQKLGLPPERLREQLNAALDALPALSGEGGEPAGASSELVQVLRAAEKEAGELGDEYVSTEHLLLALTASKGGEVRALLSDAKVTHKALLEALEAVRGTHRVTDQTPENQYQSLQRFTRDVEADSLAIERNEQKGIAGWARRFRERMTRKAAE